MTVNYPSEEFVYQTIELELQKVSIVKYLPEEFAIHNLKLSTRRDEWLRALVVKLEGYVLSTPEFFETVRPPEINSRPLLDSKGVRAKLA